MDKGKIIVDKSKIIVVPKSPVAKLQSHQLANRIKTPGDEFIQGFRQGFIAMSNFSRNINHIKSVVIREVRDVLFLGK